MQFLDISIQPSYGVRQAIVRWSVDQELTQAFPEYHVYRSPDGAGDWVRCNTDPITETEYLDVDFSFNTRTRIPHYRLLAKLPDNTLIKSTPIGLFEKLTKREYGVCHYMMKQEYRQIRVDGLPVLHYIPKTSGDIAEGWDAETGQSVSPCVTDPTKEGYGLKYVGGFREPLYTVLRMDDTGPIVKLDRDDGIGLLDEFKVMVRMLGYPRPEKGHMIVHPATDNRYLVTDVVKPFAFRGTYPVAYQTQLELLRRESPLYRVPVPDLIGVPKP
jgi:hypothetical protein